MKNGFVRYRLIVSILLSSIFFHAVGQSDDKFNTNSANEKTIGSFIHKADYYLESDLDSAIYFAEEAYRLADADDLQKSKYKAIKIIADAWYYKDSLSNAIDYYRYAAETIKEIEGDNSEEYASRISDIGYCYYRIEIFDMAVSYYNQALTVFKQKANIEEISNQLNNLGTVYFAWGNYNLALEHFSRTLTYDIERGDSAALSTSYNNIGKVYDAWGYYDLAIEHYYNSLSFLNDRDDGARRSIRLSNIGMSYFNKNDSEKALEFIFSALKINQKLDNQTKIAARYNEIASVFSAKGDYSKAIEYNKEALQILQSQEKKESLAIVLKDLGSIYINTAKYELAENYLKQSISIAHEIGSITNEMVAYEMLAKVYEKREDFKQSNFYHRKYDALKDTIFNALKHKQLANYRIRYETEKKERENQMLKKDILIKKRAQRTLIIIGGFVLMSAVLLFFLLRLKSRTLKQDRKLFEKDKKFSNLELEKKEIERDYLQDKVFAEQQLNRLQQDKHTAEIQLKNRELVSSTLQLINKNEVLAEIKNKFKLHNSEIPEIAYKDIIQLVNQNTDFDQNWKSFSVEFEKINPGFFDRIRNSYPDFSEQFIRLSAFLRIDLSTKEIAQLMNVSVAAVNKSRQRLRKKLNLEAEADLTVFMKSV